MLVQIHLGANTFGYIWVHLGTFGYKWLEYPTTVREGPGSKPTRVKTLKIRFNG